MRCHELGLDATLQLDEVSDATALNLPLLKGASVIGALLGGAIRNDPERYRAMLDELTTMWAEGRLTPHVSKTYPLAEAAQAVRDVAERRAVGRIVVAVQR
jgi:NADPH:quinone reductase